MKRLLRILIAVLALLLAAIAGGAVGFAILFWCAYLSCRAIAWVTGNANLMYLMWLVMPMTIVAVIAGGVVEIGRAHV